MELLALTAGAAMVIVRTKRQKEAELAARERRSMKRRRRLWVNKWLLRRAPFGQYDKRQHFGRRKAAVVLRKVAEGLRYTCGQYASFTVLNMFNFSASTRETCGRSRKRAIHLAVYLRFPAVLCGCRTADGAENRGLNRISVKGVLHRNNIRVTRLYDQWNFFLLSVS